MTSELPNYRRITDEELSSMLQAASGSKELATNFWRPLTDFPVRLIKEGNYSQAQGLLFHLLHKCQAVAPAHFPKIHKGNPYYWLGITTFLIHDYQTATFFFDAAVTEDLDWGADPEKDPTPAIFFITLDGKQPNQSAQKLVQIAEAKVLISLEFYKSLAGRPSWLPDFSMPRLRAKFLRPALDPKNRGWRTLVTTFISFFLEWDFRNGFFDIRPGKGSVEPFYLHLFKGCVLFESLLKENQSKPISDPTLWSALTSLSKELGFSGKPEDQTWTFPDIINDLSNADHQIETAMRFTYRVRNIAGHHLSWNIDLNQGQYQRLFEMIAASCLHAIACLY